MAIKVLLIAYYYRPTHTHCVVSNILRLQRGWTRIYSYKRIERKEQDESKNYKYEICLPSYWNSWFCCSLSIDAISIILIDSRALCQIWRDFLSSCQTLCPCMFLILPGNDKFNVWKMSFLVNFKYYTEEHFLSYFFENWGSIPEILPLIIWYIRLEGIKMLQATQHNHVKYYFIKCQCVKVESQTGSLPSYRLYWYYFRSDMIESHIRSFMVV